MFHYYIIWNLLIFVIKETPKNVELSELKYMEMPFFCRVNRVVELSEVELTEFDPSSALNVDLHLVEMKASMVESYLRWMKGIVEEYLRKKDRDEMNETSNKLNSIGEKYISAHSCTDIQIVLLLKCKMTFCTSISH